MLCPSVFQPVSVPVPSLLDLHWPVRSLWPELRPLLFRAEAEMLRHLQELQLSLGHMERLHQRIFQELDQDLGLGLGLGPGLGLGGGAFRPIGFTHEEPGPDGAFALSLDTADFSPSELRVSQVGRKLRVSGRSERTRGGGAGGGGGDEASNSYRCQEFRQEIDLPGGVDAGAVTCSLQGGRLHIQAPPQRAVHDGKERVVPITLTSAPAVTSPPPPSESGEEN